MEGYENGAWGPPLQRASHDRKAGQRNGIRQFPKEVLPVLVDSKAKAAWWHKGSLSCCRATGGQPLETHPLHTVIHLTEPRVNSRRELGNYSSIKANYRRLRRGILESSSSVGGLWGYVAETVSQELHV